MNKIQLDYVKNRVSEVVKCTNGEIATSFNNLKKESAISLSEKLDQIRSNTAVLRPVTDLTKADNFHHYNNFHEVLLKCFEYKETFQQVKDRQYNERVETKKEDIMTEVTLAGKRLIDDIILGIVELDLIPEKLHELASVTVIARRYKERDFLN